MNTLVNYFSYFSKKLAVQSELIKLNFATHRPSGGSNRERLVADLLKSHLPKAYGVTSGLIVSGDGAFSNQADVIIYDSHSSRPLHEDDQVSVCFVESVLAMVEVKTSLDKVALKDSIEKCRRFKRLKRDFDPMLGGPKIKDTLFCIWAFDGPTPETLKANLTELYQGVPMSEQPDFILVQGSVLFMGGDYRMVAKLGQTGSQHYVQKMALHGNNKTVALGGEFEGLAMAEYSLMAWMIWLRSWLSGAVPRGEVLFKYLPPSMILGKQVQ